MISAVNSPALKAQDLDFTATRAGQPGMAVARTHAEDSEVAIIGFTSNGTDNPDAFVVVKFGERRMVHVTVKGTTASRTSGWYSV